MSKLDKNPHEHIDQLNLIKNQAILLNFRSFMVIIKNILYGIYMCM